MKNKLLGIFLTLTFLISFNTIYSKDLKGTVLGKSPDNKTSPLPRATVQWLGTNIGTFTDNNGKFIINFPENVNKLLISFIGYEKDTIEIKKDQTEIDVTLNSSLQLGTINVYGEMPGMVMSQSTIAKTETITSKGLKKAACCNLSESFQNSPTVDVNYTDAVTGAKQIQLLGLQGIYIQMLSEQIPNLRGIASTFGLNYIPGTWMESIQVSKGTGSVLQGHESISGQINVEYKKPDVFEPLFVNLYANQEGRLEGNMNSAYQISDKLSTMILAHIDYMNNKIDGNGDNFLDFPLITNYNLFNRWMYKGDNFGTRTGIQYLYEDRKSGQSGFFPNDDNQYYGVDIKTRRFQVYNKTGFFLNDKINSSLGIINTWTRHTQNSFFGNNNFDAAQNSYYLNAIYQQDVFKKSSFSGGLSYTYDEYNENFKDSAMFRKESVPGIFAELTFSDLGNFQIIGGIRYDFDNLYGNYFTPRVHVRYQPFESLTFRASIGSGFRTDDIYSENVALLGSSRIFHVEGQLKPEKAWNTGLNVSYNFDVFGLGFTLNTDFYRTDFVNQVIVDIDRDPSAVYFYNLTGNSYANSFQTDLRFTPIKHLDIILAYRLNEVKMTIDSSIQSKPLQPRFKAFLNLGYSINDNEWSFDFTADLNGGGRLPNTSMNPLQYRLGNNFPAYMLFFGQISKHFESFDIYLGAENIFDYRQPNPILAFSEPFGKYFDSSIIWAPITGRNIYLGIRVIPF